ncbi:MAG: 2-oxo acid dehydrogenase subunit E2 [Deltaproteobacteria bacterium]|nr:MAG: 2-oxo acid dehydrogenase subunit E2 [Deltaproteobacteria bacterium]TMB34182.1 MAG: 2-oxo acid dehydrogenase subunit E2 [Deltaproteobacteria bacterium]
MDVVMPQLGETVKEGTVIAWRKKVGERVEKDEPLFEVNTDKVDMDVPSPATGVVSAILVAEGATVRVGEKLAVISEPGSQATREPGVQETRLSPVVRKLLAEHGLDAAAIQGTGAGGRITRDDVLAHLAQRGAPQRKVVPFSRIRKVTAERMALSWRTIPHVLQAVEVDFLPVEEVRLAAAEAWKAKEGFNLTLLPFVAHAVCAAIREFPNVNASVEGDGLVLHGAVHLGVAVDLGTEGLLVPVVKDAGNLGVADLARRMRGLAEKARDKRLSADEVSGATYTISNSGKFGTLLTVPIIDPPQVAILSLDAVTKRPAVVGDALAVRPIGVLAQSFDHRAFDGAYSASFLRRVKEILEGRDWARDL